MVIKGSGKQAYSAITSLLSVVKIASNWFEVILVQLGAKVVYTMQTFILALKHEQDDFNSGVETWVGWLFFYLQACRFAHFSLWCSCLAKMPKGVARGEPCTGTCFAPLFLPALHLTADNGSSAYWPMYLCTGTTIHKDQQELPQIFFFSCESNFSLHARYSIHWRSLLHDKA